MSTGCCGNSPAPMSAEEKAKLIENFVKDNSNTLNDESDEEEEE